MDVAPPDGLDSGPAPLPDEVLDALVTVLDEIRLGRSRSRSELMTRTGLGRAIVARRVQELLDRGLITEGEVGPSTGGRPPRQLGFRADAGHVLVADLGATSISVALTDLAGRIIGHYTEPAEISSGPEAILGRVDELFGELQHTARSLPGPVWGVGLGVPGPVHFASGRPVSPPIMPGWDGYPVARHLGERFGAPVLLERDVNAMALGEHRRYWRDLSHLVFVKVATGIGAGIISDGELLRGNHGRAGDIGHIRAIRQSDVECSCGNRGCVAVLASGGALVRQLSEAGFDVSAPADVVELVRAGRAVPMNHVREAGRVLGAALAAVVSVVAPTAIVIGGELADASEPLLAGIRESVYQRASALATRELRILTSRLGPRAGVVGATTLALEHVLEPANVDALLVARGLAA
jgi:predicted NBD/HSP70 family sugar kinase